MLIRLTKHEQFSVIRLSDGGVAIEVPDAAVDRVDDGDGYGDDDLADDDDYGDDDLADDDDYGDDDLADDGDDPGVKLVFEESARTVQVGRLPLVRLSAMEFDLLRCVDEHAGQVFIDDLQAEVPATAELADNAIRAVVSRITKKLVGVGSPNTPYTSLRYVHFEH